MKEGSNSEEGAQKKAGGHIFRGIKGMAKMIIGKSQPEIDGSMDEESTKNLIFNVLSQFIHHFANFGVSLEGG